MSSGYFFQSKISARGAGPGNSGCTKSSVANPGYLNIERPTCHKDSSQSHRRVTVSKHEDFHEPVPVQTEVVIYEDEASEANGWNEGGLSKVEGKEAAISDANPSEDPCIAQRNPPGRDRSPWLILRILLWASSLVIDVEL